MPKFRFRGTGYLKNPVSLRREEAIGLGGRDAGVSQLNLGGDA
ncbi:hypothetical protein [[Phormidium] sp. ETS-05]|nr:hypothetical protein [[Phormidium] sp. ETS-05]